MEPLIIYNIGELITVAGSNVLRKGKAMSDVEVMYNGYIVIEDGKFKEVSTGDGYLKYHSYKKIDAKNRLVTPGLIDSHTHLVHASSREEEFHLKLNGVSYLEILKNGGGILSTVKKTRAASFNNLLTQAKKSLDRMLEYGVVAVESKSGYGLELETELKQLEVSKKLNEIHPVDITNTFLGAHAILDEYKNQKHYYIEELKKMMIEVKNKKLAEFCDVFCEEGVFSVEESEEILKFASNCGFGLKIHADEIVPLGGAKLASDLMCKSADHLTVTSVSDMKLLAKNDIVCNILPLTSFYLDKSYANTRVMIDNNCGIAISTDYNPGSSPSENIQLAMQIASIKTKMTPKEVITAVTINGAKALGLEETKGSIEIGKDADFVIYDANNLDYIFYHFGVNHVKDVYIKGKRVVKDQKICY